MIRYIWITFVFAWAGCAHTTSDHTLQAVIELSVLQCALEEQAIINRPNSVASADRKSIDGIRKICDQAFDKLAKITGQDSE